MSDEHHSFLENLIGELKKQRDEIRLQLHLGGKDLKVELEKLDDRLAELTQRFQPLRKATEETAEDVWDALKLLGSEVKDGFDRIRHQL